jgi:hypothetical protein
LRERISPEKREFGGRGGLLYLLWTLCIRGGTRLGGYKAICLALLRLSEDKEIYMRVGCAWITNYSWFDGVVMPPISIT